MLVCKWFANTEEAQLCTYILKTNKQTNKKYKKKKKNTNLVITMRNVFCVLLQYSSVNPKLQELLFFLCYLFIYFFGS